VQPELQEHGAGAAQRMMTHCMMMIMMMMH
jgi:hypothetical protein